MHIMPHATPRRANAYVHLAHADGPNGAGVTSNSVRRTMVELNMKASIFYTWLVKTLHNVLSSFAISLVLFCLLGLGFFLHCILFLSVANRRLCSALDSTKHVRCGGAAALSSLSSSLDLVPRLHAPPSSCM